jgi:hypothetical protein
MAEVKKTAAPALVSCATCLKEIPASEAKSEEAADYVRYFCGLDCFDQWHTQAKAHDKRKE